VDGRIWKATLPESSVTVYLVEQADYFERDDSTQGRGLYHYTLPNGQKRDYPDNCERYVFFCRAVLDALPRLNFWPDVLHANDWQTGLMPVYLKELYSRVDEDGPRYARMRSMFTIHNIAYQGIFWHWDMPLTGLDWRLFNYRALEFHGHLNLLKAGIVFADVITTVSPRYAQEIQTPYFGCGLEGALAEHRHKLHGIVNGADYGIWNPATDPHLVARYDSASVVQGKAECKIALQRRYNLALEPRAPLLGMVTRLVDQKGLNLLGKAADILLREGVQLVVLGEGDPVYHRMLQELHDRYPERVGLTLDFDEHLAHQIEAGADSFLMPSLYEPSGLSQLYSLKYGTVPVVRATGGLADTIVDCTPETLTNGSATGFTFVAQTGAALLETVHRAAQMFRQEPERWLELMRNGMRQDWSWNRSAAEYEKLFEKIRGKG
jgi:starch synthase